MNKIKLLVLTSVLFFVGILNVDAITYSSRDACVADAGGNTNLATVTTRTTVRSCVENYCNAQLGTYDTYMVKEKAAYGTCANGNRNPYKTKTFGYERSGTCKYADRRAEIVYTNMDITYDCTKTSNGQPYSNTTTTTTKKQNTTKKTTSPGGGTTKSTTKRTGDTTTSVIGGNDSTTKTGITTPEETTTTTTKVLTNDASIRKITINNKFDLGYTSDVHEYSIKVPYSLNDFDVYVETSDSNAKVDISGTKSISSEGGVITIDVTSSDGTASNQVKINVSRYTKEEGDCSLADLYIKDYTIDFSSSKEQYTIKLVDNDKFLEIEATPSNPSSIYSINGNEKLKNNSKIEIVVEAVDGTICTYVITTKKSSKLLLYLLIAVIVGVVLFFAVKKLIEVSTKGKNKYRYE